MERPNLSALRAKLFKIKDNATQDIIGQLLNYVEELETIPIPPNPKPKPRGMRAKDYKAQIELEKLPKDTQEKKENSLSFLVQKALEYAFFLEKQLKI